MYRLANFFRPKRFEFEREMQRVSTAQSFLMPLRRGFTK